MVVLPPRAIVLLYWVSCVTAGWGGSPFRTDWPPGGHRGGAAGPLWLVVGLLLRSAAGLAARRLLERRVFELIPGYRLAKAFAGDGPWWSMAVAPCARSRGNRGGPVPGAGDGRLADGRLVVFVPGSPAPMSGALYVFAPEKVTYLDVPLLAFLKVISSWGLGLREMIEAEARTRPETVADHTDIGPATLSVAAGSNPRRLS